MNKYLGRQLDGRYEIRELIGIGGMADVYKGFDLYEQKTVAVKILKEEYLTNEDFKRRFRNESKAISVLSHPNIVKIFDVNFGDTVQYIVMEFVDGITLKEYIQQQNVVIWREAVHFTVQILRALQHAHDTGIVHRDVKPQNVMLLQDGTVKVMDFGIARFARDNGRTISEKAIGSVHYISPEQAKGEITDERTDIYSVGVLLFEMLTGKLPFDGDTPVTIAVKQMQEEAPTPRSINPDIPVGLEEIVIRAMKKDPDLRYQTAAEMLRDLDEFKRNPNTVFEYKYFTEDGKTQYFDTVEDADYRDNKKPVKNKKKMSASMQVLMAVAIACVVIAVIAVVMFFMGLNKSKVEISLYDFVGKTYEEVIKDPQYDNVEIVKLEEEKSDKYEAGIIIEQNPKANTKVKEGSTVKVVVSSVLSSLNLPDVSKKSQNDAKKVLTQLELKVRIVTEESREVDAGYVIRTEPAANEVVKPGQTISVVVSSGPPTSTSVPSLIGLTEAQALQELSRRDLTAQINRVESTETKGTVIGQNPSAGSTVPFGSSVVIQVSDGKVVSSSEPSRPESSKPESSTPESSTPESSSSSESSDNSSAEVVPSPPDNQSLRVRRSRG